MEHSSMEHSSIVSFESQGVSYYGAPEPADVEFMIPVYRYCVNSSAPAIYSSYASSA